MSLLPTYWAIAGAQGSDVARDGGSQRIEHVAPWLERLSVADAGVVANSFGGSLLLLAAIERAWPVTKAVSISGTGGLYMIAERYWPLREYAATEEAMREIVLRFVSPT